MIATTEIIPLNESKIAFSIIMKLKIPTRIAITPITPVTIWEISVLENPPLENLLNQNLTCPSTKKAIPKRIIKIGGVYFPKSRPKKESEIIAKKPIILATARTIKNIGVILFFTFF